MTLEQILQIILIPLLAWQTHTLHRLDVRLSVLETEQKSLRSWLANLSLKINKTNKQPTEENA